jgi:hypothetical protein
MSDRDRRRLAAAATAALVGLLGAGCSGGTPPPTSAQRRATETAHWTQRTSLHAPLPRYGGSVVYDPARGKTFLFGGVIGTSPTNEVWLWDGTDWEQLCTSTSCGTAPAARSFAAAARLLASPGGLLVFGGADGASTNLQDTWKLGNNGSGATWSKACGPCLPGVARAAAMVVDEARSRTLLFGGANGATHYRITYDWVGADWAAVCDPVDGCTSPPGVRAHGMAFDAVSQKAVLFGGSDAGTVYDDTWLLGWNSTASRYEWAAASPSGAPAARLGLAITYSADEDAVLVSGGTDGTISLGDTWRFDGTSWTEDQGTPRPAPRYAAGMTYDTGRHAAVLYGGFDYAALATVADTWEREGGVWTQRAVHPRSYHTMVYDSSRQRVVAFGGTSLGFAPDVWEWDGRAWTPRPIATAAAPPGRRGAAMAYHEFAQLSLVMGGGDYGGFRGDTWAWDGTAWTKLLDTGGVLPEIQGHAAAYDGARQVVVAFGGNVAGTPSDTTYRLRGPGGGWSWEATCTGSCVRPPARSFPAMTYDPVRQQVLLYGGFSDAAGTAPLDDLWAWDGSSWTQLCTTSPCNGGQRPSARGAGGMAFDHHRGRAILFGGQENGGAYPPGIWEWDGVAWRPPSAGGPEGRAAMAVAYDAARRAVLIYGGSVGSGSRADTWEYRVSGSLCATADDCDTGFCADGVCCESACAGPCDVCSVAAGSSADGVCRPAPAGTSGGCPSHVACDGLQAGCPATCAASGAPACEAGYECVGGACVGGGDGGTPGDGGATGDGAATGDGGHPGDGGTGGGARASVLSCAAHPGAGAGVSLPLLVLLLACGARRRRARG